MGTKNNPGAFDCYANAEPDEPMFVLLGRDKHAPTLVWLWAILRELDGEDVAKVQEARQCVADMMTFAHGKGRSVSGLGVAVLAGAMELTRTINGCMHELRTLKNEGPPKNDETTVEEVRRFLSETNFDAVESADAPRAHG
jgi:hypothetical protein